MVKVCGEALAVDAGWGVDPASLAHISGEILAMRELGVQVAVVIGGGNYFRGRMAQRWGIGRAEAENIGMLGTVMNALMLRGALTGVSLGSARSASEAGCGGDVEPSHGQRVIS